MKTLDQLQVNQTAVVTAIHAPEDLKQRLFSFGVRRGTSFKVKAFGLANSTVEIEVGATMLALRNEEAKCIEVSLVCEL
jgi:ferrous iron transport protein A